MGAAEKLESKGLVYIASDKPALIKEDEAEFNNRIKEVISDASFEDAEGLVLDLTKIKQMSVGYARIFATVHMNLRKKGKTLSLLITDHNMKHYIKNVQGLSVPVYLSKEELEQKVYGQSGGAKKKAPAVDVEFIGPFVDAAIKTLNVQCGVEAKAAKPFIKEKDANFKYAIAGSIGLTSRYFKGSISICFSKEAFLAIMGNMLGEEYSEIDAELEDGAGELLNIIFGQAKITLNEKGYQIEKAIPTIIRGENIEVRHLTPDPTLVLPFSSEVGDFNIEVGVENN